MFEYVNFTKVSGKNCERELKLLTLITCGHCKKAKNFLSENELSHSFIDVDSLDIGVRKQIRKDFRTIFKKNIVYPTLLIEEKDVLVGFTRSTWGSTLLEKD